MKESSCFLNDLFFYTPLYYEVKGIRAEVEDMEDEYLVDEVVNLCEDNSEIDSIICKHFYGTKITDEDREKLIWFYVIVNIEDYLMILDDGEY